MNKKELLQLQVTLQNTILEIQNSLELVNRELREMESQNVELNMKRMIKLEGKVRVTECLRIIGVPKKLKGYEYIYTALMMILEDKTKIYNLRNGLYNDIAKEYATTSVKVGDSIRNAIEATWRRGNKEALKKVFGEDSLRPTNFEFISTLADWIE